MDNYKKAYSDTPVAVVCLFNDIITMYLEYIVKTTYISDESYLSHTVNLGLESLHYVFSFLYLYTKNSALAKHHTENGCYIYCEFIGNIGIKHDSLRINSKDAQLFMLKKTIYLIDNKHTRNFKLTNQEHEHINYIDTLSEMYLYIVKMYLVCRSKQSFIDKVNKKTVMFPLHNLKKVIELIKHVSSTESLASLKKINILLCDLSDVIEYKGCDLDGEYVYDNLYDTIKKVIDTKTITDKQ